MKKVVFEVAMVIPDDMLATVNNMISGFYNNKCSAISSVGDITPSLKITITDLKVEEWVNKWI